MLRLNEEQPPFLGLLFIFYPELSRAKKANLVYKGNKIALIIFKLEECSSFTKYLLVLIGSRCLLVSINVRW